jgi:hypothetical protein
MATRVGGSGESRPEDRALALEVKGQLDSLVVSIELTLVSIVQGTALGALVTAAQTPILELDWRLWPRILTGLLLILVFWSRAVIHTLGFIRWPLDLVHNFLYVAVALVEVLTINALGDATHWFALNAAWSAAGWVLYAVDTAMLRREEAEFEGENARKLYDDMLADQRRDLRLFLPAGLVFSVVAALFPAQAFAASVLQTGFYAWYLADGVRALRRRQGWILQQLVDLRRGRGLAIREDEAGMDIGGSDE